MYSSSSLQPWSSSARRSGRSSRHAPRWKQEFLCPGVAAPHLACFRLPCCPTTECYPSNPLPPAQSAQSPHPRLGREVAEAQMLLNALPYSFPRSSNSYQQFPAAKSALPESLEDRKSTRLNSSHS